jgi:thiol:disulfide interchange protein DsbA
MFDEWTKTVENKTKVEKVPVSFGAAGDSYQSIYYTLQAMGQLNKYHAKLFQTAQSEPNSLLTKSNCVDWAQAQGIDSAVFSEKFDSPEVRAKVERAKSLEQAYQVVSVPSIGVFGLALVSPGGTWQNFLDKVQLLMELNKSVWTD